MCTEYFFFDSCRCLHSLSLDQRTRACSQHMWACVLTCSNVSQMKTWRHLGAWMDNHRLSITIAAKPSWGLWVKDCHQHPTWFQNLLIPKLRKKWPAKAGDIVSSKKEVSSSQMGPMVWATHCPMGLVKWGGAGSPHPLPCDAAKMR